MSLIADSLKKASKEKLASLSFKPRVPLMRGSRLSGNPSSRWLRILLLIVVPGSILALMLYFGLEPKKDDLIAKRPLPEEASATREKFPPIVPAVRSAPVEEKKKFPVAKLEKTEPVIPRRPVVSPQPLLMPRMPEKVVRGAENILPLPQSSIAIPAEIPKSSPVKIEEKPIAESKPVVLEPVQKNEILQEKPSGEKVVEEKAVVEKTPVKISEKNLVTPSPAQEAVQPREETSLPEQPVAEPVPSETKPKLASSTEPSAGKPAQQKKPAEKKPLAVKPAPKPTPETATPKIVAPAIEASPPATKPEERVASLPLTISRPDAKMPEDEDIFKDGVYYFNRAVFFQKAKEWDKAITEYTKALEFDGNNPDIYNNLGVVYKEKGELDQAIEEFLRSVYLDPDYSKAYNNIGITYYMKQQYDEAIRNYSQAIQIDPANLEAFNNLAIVYKKLNEMDKANDALNQALAIDPGHAGTNYNLAVLNEDNGNLTPALHYYRRFMKLGESTHPNLVFQVKKHIQTLTK